MTSRTIEGKDNKDVRVRVRGLGLGIEGKDKTSLAKPSQAKTRQDKPRQDKTRHQKGKQKKIKMSNKMERRRVGSGQRVAST